MFKQQIAYVHGTVCAINIIEIIQWMTNGRYNCTGIKVELILSWGGDGHSLAIRPTPCLNP